MQELIIQLTVKLFPIGFMQGLILQSLKPQFYKIFKTLKFSYLQQNGLKIVLLPQFSLNQSVWWPYMQCVINMDFTKWMYNYYTADVSSMFIYLFNYVHLLVTVQNNKRYAVHVLKKYLIYVYTPIKRYGGPSSIFLRSVTSHLYFALKNA